MQLLRRPSLALACLAIMAGCQSPPAPEPLETALPPATQSSPSPIPPSRYAGWKQAYRLTNSAMEVVVVPAVGRIMHLGLAGQPNLLRNDPELLGKRPPLKGDWPNFGGDWLWPVPQVHWPRIAGKDWPPPPVLADQPWDGSAWSNADGSQSCLIMRRYGDPVNLLVSRLITMDAHRPRVRILQRIMSLGYSPLPACLWTITQVAQPSRILFPAEPTGGGYRQIAFAPPLPGQVTNVEGIVVIDTLAGGEHKFGSGAQPAWIAAQRDQVLLLEYETNQAQGPLPDGGCAVETYVNTTSGYAEIETLTPEVILEAGDRLENTLFIECRTLNADATAEDAARAVRTAMSGALGR